MSHHALVPRRHYAAEAHVVTDQRLQLERDVLEDVRDVSAFGEPLNESSRVTASALMEVEAWNGLDKSLNHARNFGRSDLLE